MSIRYLILFLVSIGLGCGSITPVGAQITVTDSVNGNALADRILPTGVTRVGNATLFGQSDGGGAQQGFFTSDIGTLGLTGGTLLTTGYAHNVVGDTTDPSQPNISTNTTKEWGAVGDTDLTILAGTPTFDANTLSFNFTVAPATTAFNLQYVFGSEEYTEFIGSINDLIAIYVDGVDIGLAPTTTDPVSVSSINPFTDSAFYRDNEINPTDPNKVYLDTELDGLTTVLSANVLAALNPNLTTHTLKIGIADALDDNLDSALFIGSNRSAPAATPEPGTLSMGVGILAAGVLTIRKRRTLSTPR
jgi:hypothetical protein